MQQPILTSELTCPHCGRTSIEDMPTDACAFFHDCPGCGTVLSPKPGDCCVFCSYGSIPCPPVQGAAACCTRGSSSLAAAPPDGPAPGSQGPEDAP